jgi:tetratricopeptide (TPR) repeat protein
MSHAPFPPRHAHLLTLIISLCLLVSARGTEGVKPDEPEAKKEENHVLVPVPAVEKKVHEAKGLLVLGASLTDRGDYQAAEIAYRRILSSREFGTPAQKDALLGIAHMFRRAGNFTKAAAIYEKFIKTFPDESRVPDALLDLGRTLRDMGAYKLAISRFYNVINSALKLPPEGFEHYQLLAKTAQFEIAETHFEAGNFTEAGKYFSRLRLLDLAPADRARAHFKSAYAQILSGDKENAINTLHDYLQQWPDDENVPEAQHLMATTLRQLNRTEEAMTATLTLLRNEQAHSEADPKRWVYWQRRTGNQLANEFFENGDTMYALTIYQGLAALSPDPVWRLPVTYQIALCYERLRLLDRARTSYKTIVDAVAAAPATPALTPDLQELAKMSSWRLAHLDWSEQTDRQLSVFFSTTTGQPHAAPVTPPIPQ